MAVEYSGILIIMRRGLLVVESSTLFHIIVVISGFCY